MLWGISIIRWGFAIIRWGFAIIRWGFAIIRWGFAIIVIILLELHLLFYIHDVSRIWKFRALIYEVKCYFKSTSRTINNTVIR
jgi:hypothetical protein